MADPALREQRVPAGKADPFARLVAGFGGCTAPSGMTSKRTLVVNRRSRGVTSHDRCMRYSGSEGNLESDSNAVVLGTHPSRRPVVFPPTTRSATVTSEGEQGASQHKYQHAGFRTRDVAISIPAQMQQQTRQNRFRLQTHRGRSLRQRYRFQTIPHINRSQRRLRNHRCPNRSGRGRPERARKKLCRCLGTYCSN